MDFGFRYADPVRGAGWLFVNDRPHIAGWNASSETGLLRECNSTTVGAKRHHVKCVCFANGFGSFGEGFFRRCNTVKSRSNEKNTAIHPTTEPNILALSAIASFNLDSPHGAIA
jgi:hypothetical protein